MRVLWPSFNVSKNVGWERVFLSVDRGGSWLEGVSTMMRWCGVAGRATGAAASTWIAAIGACLRSWRVVPSRLEILPA